jgi:hypothetical protein
MAADVTSKLFIISNLAQTIVRQRTVQAFRLHMFLNNILV